jgi:tRNA threonylcarbamoyladenosine modification (KEOPS) complex  Pcc1 subunit
MSAERRMAPEHVARYDLTAIMSKFVSLQRDLCLVEVIEGETDDLERQVCESSLVEGLSRSGVSLQSIEINAAGCFVVVKCEDVARLKAIAKTFNVAIRVHEHCGRICQQRRTARTTLPSITEVISALHKQRVKIVDVAANGAELSVLVDAAEIDPAMAVMDFLSTATAHQYAA